MNPREAEFRDDLAALLNKHDADYECEANAEINLAPILNDDGTINQPHIYFTLDRFMYPTGNHNESDT